MTNLKSLRQKAYAFHQKHAQEIGLGYAECYDLMAGFAEHELESAHTRILAQDERILELLDLLEEARSNARILAHAYEHDSRPPAKIVKQCLAYPVKLSQ